MARGGSLIVVCRMMWVLVPVFAVGVLGLVAGAEARETQAGEAQEPQAGDSQSRETPEPGLPTGVCGGGVCGPAQRRIWTRFERGEGLAARAGVYGGVYAGICYVRDDRYDPDREHHVGFLIDENHESDESGAETVGRLFLRFSFFAAANPFDGLDANAARARLGDAASPVLPVALYDGHAYAGYADMTFFARYWFRRDPDSGRVLLVSYFGDRMTIICDAAETAA